MHCDIMSYIPRSGSVGPNCEVINRHVDLFVGGSGRYDMDMYQRVGAAVQPVSFRFSTFSRFDEPEPDVIFGLSLPMDIRGRWVPTEETKKRKRAKNSRVDWTNVADARTSTQVAWNRSFSLCFGFFCV